MCPEGEYECHTAIIAGTTSGNRIDDRSCTHCRSRPWKLCATGFRGVDCCPFPGCSSCSRANALARLFLIDPKTKDLEKVGGNILCLIDSYWSVSSSRMMIVHCSKRMSESF